MPHSLGESFTSRGIPRRALDVLGEGENASKEGRLGMVFRKGRTEVTGVQMHGDGEERDAGKYSVNKCTEVCIGTKTNLVGMRGSAERRVCCKDLVCK